MTIPWRLNLARGKVDLLVALVVDPLVDLPVDLLVGVISAAAPLFPHHSADCGNSDFKRSLRHIEVGT